MEIAKINDEVSRELADPKTMQTLVETTFKGLQPAMIKQAMVAGYLRGFTFKDFLEKNIYAIPFGSNYSLVTSIDYARKVGMRSGVVGISAPAFVEKDGTVISCTVTVKRKVGGDIGEFSATAYFSEYDTKRNLWASKPRTMIAKVAEVSALRKACPEELSQMYTADEMGEKAEQKDNVVVVDVLDEKYIKEIAAIKTVDELKAYYLANKGKGKLFDQAVSAHKKFLLTVQKDEAKNI
jgi:hypothetical protein